MNRSLGSNRADGLNAAGYLIGPCCISTAKQISGIFGDFRSNGMMISRCGRGWCIATRRTQASPGD